MNVEVVDSLGDLEGLQREWWALYRICPRATPFQSPAWLIHWVRHLYRGGDILVLAMREGGELIGLASLFCWGLGRRTVSFLGAGISDYGDLLFAPGFESGCAAAVWDFLDRRRGGRDSLDLQELRGDSGLLEGRRAEPCAVCPVLDLSTYPDAMDAKLRTDLRRAKGKLSGQAKVQFATSKAGSFPACQEAFFALYEKRWGAMDTSLRPFHQAVMTEFLAAGLLRLFSLRIGDAPAAAVYAFTSGTTLYCYLSGFDSALAKLSPGMVLLGRVIDQAVEDGLKEVDFLRHPEAYKYLWGARDRVNFKIHEPPSN